MAERGAHRDEMPLFAIFTRKCIWLFNYAGTIIRQKETCILRQITDDIGADS